MTWADADSWLEGLLGRYLPVIVSLFSLVVATILISIGIDRSLVLALSGTWLAMALFLHWNAGRSKGHEVIPIDPGSEIEKHLGSEFLNDVRVGTYSRISENSPKIGVSSDDSVAIDAELLRGLAPEITAKVIQLTYKARLFNLISFVKSIFMLWPVFSVFAILHLKTLPSLLGMFEPSIAAFAGIVVFSLIEQYFKREPVLVKSEAELNSLQEAQAFLEAQSLSILLPTSGWTRFKVWFSRMIVRREMRRFHHRARSDSSTG